MGRAARRKCDVSLFLDSFVDLWLTAPVRLSGWGVTVFDSLTTLWIMGMKQQFTEALALVDGTVWEAVSSRHPAQALHREMKRVLATSFRNTRQSFSKQRFATSAAF